MKKIYLYLVLGFLLVGFATISTVILINGDVKISSNSEDFDIYFSRSILNNVDKTNEIIDKDGGKTINFEVTMKEVNEISKLEYEVTNNSTQYDAVVSVSCTTNSDKVTFSNTPSEINVKAGDIGSGTMTIKLLSSLVEESNELITCTLVADADVPEPTIEKYTVSFNEGDFTLSTDSLSIDYSSSSEITITPNEHRYIKDIVCSDGYSTSLTEPSMFNTPITVTINNNGVTGDGSCEIIGDKEYIAAASSSSVVNKSCTFYQYNCTGAIKSYINRNDCIAQTNFIINNLSGICQVNCAKYTQQNSVCGTETVYTYTCPDGTLQSSEDESLCIYN